MARMVSRLLRSTFLPVALTPALLLPAGAAFTPGSSSLAAQQPDADARAVRLQAQPVSLTLRVGDTATVEIRAVDAAGRVVDADVRLVGPRQDLRVDGNQVEGLRPGEHELVATLASPPAGGADADPVTLRIPVTVTWPALARLEVTKSEGRLYAGTTLGHRVRAFHADGTERPDPNVRWSSSDPSVAEVDAFGQATAVAPGRVQIRAEVEGVTEAVAHDVAPFPGERIELRGGRSPVHTGDVLRLDAVVIDAAGQEVEDVPIAWGHSFQPTRDDEMAAAAPGQVTGDGRFVADLPGRHTVLATAGPLSTQRTLEALPRDVVREVELVGVGRQSDIRTTDFWVFEGLDGRDYVITGSKRADGHAYVFDVTDPGNPVKTDSVQVDARAVNDVKVSPDGRYATVTREGASDRRNGVVLLDLADPAHPVVASQVVEGLTGGVHNAFPTDSHVFALSDGDKYVIIDVADIRAPRVVGEYDHPDSRVHDVWVHDGLAYSAEWGTGLVVTDVGDGRWGGSPENPVLVSTYPLPTGRTHAAFPYVQESTGKHYVFVGDEIMSRRGLAWGGYPRSMGSYADQHDPEQGIGGIPLTTTGYVQVIDFSDPEDPEMVARYEVPEYGTHNIWVEDDILYQAYYEGGLRVVDVSGELMGNLYTQGREMAVFKSVDPQGYVANSTMVWSAMPFKGHVFFSDTNSGLWAVRIQPEERPIS